MRRRLTSLLAAAVLAITGSFVVVTTTALPAQADACYTWGRVLKRGMSGSDVRILQSRVAGWVAYGENLALDGVFGYRTELAVKRFQRGYGLSVDGIAGSQTYSKLYQLQDSDCTPLHFSHSEFNYSCGERDYTGGAVSASTARVRMIRVMWQLEALRKKLGSRPIVITSGFRSYSCNSRVGGSSSSRHLYGDAADLGTGSGPTLCQMWRGSRYAGFEEILGPGYPGHGDHTHVANKSSRYWSASRC